MKKLCFALWLAWIAGLNGAATESREWTSVAGSKITGVAESLSGGLVSFTSDQGKALTVPLDKLCSADRAFLEKHFAVDATAPKNSGMPMVSDGLGQPVGEVVGPIDAGGGSNYFLYIPKTLRKDRLAPLLHYNGSGGGNEGSVKKHIEGAEINGWIVAASVESKNGPGHPIQNHEHAKNCVTHLIKTLPVDKKRVYFTGGSGGGAMSFYNAARIESAGAMPHIGYIPDDTKLKKGHFFVINGATDYNRYTSAMAVDSIGDEAIHRFFVGGHQEGPDWLCNEGMTWLNGRYLQKSSKDQKLAQERLDYETSLITLIGQLSETEPHRAYYWCVFLRDTYKISGPNAAVLAPLTSKLAAKPECVIYEKGISEISQFSKRQYCQFGPGSQFSHTTPKLSDAAKKLADKFASVPDLAAIATELGKPTVGK